MNHLKSSALILSALALSACATTKGIAPQYINPTTYANHSCQSLAQEIERVSKVASQTEKQQSGLSASGIGVGIAAGRGGIYPTISFGVGQSTSNQKKATLSKLYGEHDAMVVSARQKGCAFADSIKIYGE